MSWLRSHIVCTGVPWQALATNAAWAMKSISSRRPKLLPSSVRCNCTLSLAMPSTLATTCRARSVIWVPAQTCALPSLNNTVQLSGSMAACARYGALYSACTCVAAARMACSASPLEKYVKPLLLSRACLKLSITLASLVSVAVPGDQITVSLRRAFMAWKVVPATTATPAVLPCTAGSGRTL